jgi:GH25 family lysozyme M1 (1,4-beta-N-acetylmuramidase)
MSKLRLFAKASVAVALSMSVTAGLPGIAEASSAGTKGPTPVVTHAHTSALPSPKVKGIDVSRFQGVINWRKVRASGVQFAYIKATQGVGYRDPTFNYNYTAATRAGVIRGAYHFPHPGRATARAQANYLVEHGGGWSADNRTLPAMLDMEGNKAVSKDACYGLSRTAMVRWVSDFVNQYHARTGRWPVIYTGRGWWSQCTGNSRAFRDRSPLMLAAWNSEPGTPPGGWATHSIWQYTEKGRVPGITGNVDLDSFNGSRSRLLALANNTK